MLCSKSVRSTFCVSEVLVKVATRIVQVVEAGVFTAVFSVSQQMAEMWQGGRRNLYLRQWLKFCQWQV